MASQVPLCDPKKREIIVSIDFGTYGTSFAFAYSSDPDKRITVEMTWEDHDGVYFKNLTHSLYKKENLNRLVAIGFSAENRFSNMEDEDAMKHILLRKFKLGLYTNSDGEIVDKPSGKAFKVADVIGHYLASIFERILMRLNRAANSTITKKQIRFVITVPAIWNDQAKAIMREALVKAKMLEEDSVGEGDCMFVLEPEAASAFCLEKAQSLGLRPFEDGLVFMVVDAGGGTVDITVHTVDKKKLKEVTVRNGDVCGSTSIDEKFFEWLRGNFEPGSIDDMLQKDPVAYLNLRTEWERLKVASQNFEGVRFINAPDALKGLVDSGKLLPGSSDIFRRGRIILAPAVQQSIFQGALERVAQLVTDQLAQSPLAVKFILLVGGFGQSPHLFKLLKEKFVDSGQVESVVQPPQSGLAVVSGGALLGLDPSLIRSRRANQTYGIEVEEIFDESKHEESRLVTRGDLFLCKGVFFPFVETGQEIDADAVVKRNFDITGGTTRISIYTSARKKVRYVDEASVRKLGDLTVVTPPPAAAPSGAGSPPPPAASQPYITVKFLFGQIEFHVEATDHLGNRCTTKFTFANSFH